MVLQKLLSKRFFDGVKMRPFERSVVSSPTIQQVIAPLSMPGASSADGGFLRRFFLLRQAVYHSSPARFPDSCLSLSERSSGRNSKASTT
ncbi:hypothetical protein glysoja_008694 [Glycine soja]|nr:hypothetical protein glysoja_008694 [Glycine soja]